MTTNRITIININTNNTLYKKQPAESIENYVQYEIEIL